MGKKVSNNIILIGFSTTGKSKVGERVARHLGWSFIDTDEEIVKLAGKDIPRIFAEDGEEHFRHLERLVLKRACGGGETVVATGGGAILAQSNRELMIKRGMVVCLEAKAETIHGRLLQDTASSGPLRPLLATPDPQQRIKYLKEYRQPYYTIADWTVHTDNLSLEEVCQEVIRGWQYWSRAHPGSALCRDDMVTEVITATQRYPVFVGWGLLENLGRQMRQSGLSGSAYVLSDETVFSLYGEKIVRLLQRSRLKVNTFVVSPGETSKFFDEAVKAYDFLVEHRGERGDAIVALGGGMVGDLAGFIAATFLRGLPLVQVPTSLVAMVDAAIGGKVAVNHPEGKNLIGAFYQPRLVLADVETLTTLPRRELISGWAEVVKHAIVFEPGFFDFLEQHTEELIRLEPDITLEAIRQSVSIKAGVVSRDEKEKGERTLLNYGHTIAHSLEAVSQYERFLHGEAVAIGMTGAALLSQRLGLLSEKVVERQRNLLKRFGLPTTCENVDFALVLKAMELDKKVKEKTIRWVLLEDIGQPVVRGDIPLEQVTGVLKELFK